MGEWVEGGVSALMAKLVRRCTCNAKIGGSNPPESIVKKSGGALKKLNWVS